MVVSSLLTAHPSAAAELSRCTAIVRLTTRPGNHHWSVIVRRSLSVGLSLEQRPFQRAGQHWLQTAAGESTPKPVQTSFFKTVGRTPAWAPGGHRRTFILNDQQASPPAVSFNRPVTAYRCRHARRRSPAVAAYWRGEGRGLIDCRLTGLPVGKAIKFARRSGPATSRQNNRSTDGRPAVWLNKQ